MVKKNSQGESNLTRRPKASFVVLWPKQLGEQNDVQPQEMSENLPQENVYENIAENMQSKSLEELKAFYLSECTNDFKVIKNNFKILASNCKKNEPSHDVASDKENSKKNRFKNIYPYDHARVTSLSDERYINASYIEGYISGRRYIATQGPKTNTIDDFWEMVWNENSSIIVMLCKCVENGKSKCTSYWPQSGSSSTHQHLTVKGKSEEKFGGITKRTFRVDNLEEGQKRVVQFHFTSWPDHDIPLTTSGMVQLRQLVEKEHEEVGKSGPIIIHCSAGAGRTGTYIAIDNLTEEMKDTGKVDVINAVTNMRKNRKDMVQNANQYVFVYKILLENIYMRDTELPAKLIPQVLEKKDWNDFVKEEFELFFCLSSGRAMTQEENIYQNHYPTQVLSKSVNRVSVRRFDDTTVAMDAHIIEDGRYPGRFIASSSPAVGREEDFIDMILQRNAKIVVCLESQESDAFAPYRREDGDDFEMGAYAVTVVNVADFNAYKLINLHVCRTLDKELVGGFTLVYLSSWTDTYSPPHASYFAEVVSKVKASMESNEFSSAIVYCRDGCSRTGLFLVFANLMEQLKTNSNNSLDVFRTVKDLRDLRPGAVDMLSLYEQCYRIIAEYITTNFRIENVLE